MASVGQFKASHATKAQFTHEQVEHKVFLFDEPLTGSNFVMVGTKQLKHLSTLAQNLLTLPECSKFSRILAEESGSTNMITVNCAIAIMEPLSAITKLFLVL
jgi:hypothetical protein